MNMDKSSKTGQYFRHNQSVTVESHFSGTLTIQEVLKQYLLEQTSKQALDGLAGQHCHPSGSIAAGNYAKEDGG